MEKQFDHAKLLKSIEVVGMSGLSLPYIQRFFGHVGPVEEVKKIQDLVIVRFKNQTSINKALRFNGRVIDKQPIKIRTATSYISLQQMPHKKIPSRRESSKLIQELDIIIKNKAFDVPLLWPNILKFLSKLQDDKIMWLLHEIFFMKLSQVIHFHAFGTNPRSTYVEITIKQNFLNDSKNNITLIQSQGNIEKLQIMSIPSNDLQDQPSFECFLSNVETKLKLKFKQLFKSLQGQKLYELYSLFHAYSLHIPKQQSIFSIQNNMNKNAEYSVSKQFVSEQRARISLQDGKYTQRRSEYREIDTEHPSKQIEILSDSCMNENTFQYTTYDIFRDDFDGSISNNCAADIFFHYRLYFAPNYIIVRLREAGKLHYFRLDFQLRIINCHDQVIPSLDFCQFFQCGLDGNSNTIPQIKLLKHNLVLSDFEKPEKIIYILENYARFFVSQKNILINAQEKNEQKILSIFLVLSNPTEQNYSAIKKLAVQIFQNESLTLIGVKLYVIKVEDTLKFQKFKCSNFIEEYVDQVKGTFNLQIARVHARKLIEENPSKFSFVHNTEQFVTQTIWRLEQEKSKRQAKNRIKLQIHHVRSK